MTAEEFAFWDEHFSYYPFTIDRDDQRHAELLSNLMYVEGRQLKNPIKAIQFIPDYLGTRGKVSHEPTLEEQEAQFKAFVSKLKSVSPKKSE